MTCGTSRPTFCAGAGAGAEGVAVADAAFVLRVVEIERLVAPQDRPDRLARRRGDAAMHHGGPILGRGLGRELRVELDVRLRIVVDQLDRPAEQAAGRVDLLDRETRGGDHRLAVDVEPARGVVDAHDLDRVGAEGRATHHERCRERAGGSGAQDGTPAECHGSLHGGRGNRRADDRAPRCHRRCSIRKARRARPRATYRSRCPTPRVRRTRSPAGGPAPAPAPRAWVGGRRRAAEGPPIRHVRR